MRENRRAFLERLDFAVDAAFALRIEHEHESVPQAVRSSAHRWNKVCVWINRDEAQEFRKAAHQTFAEDFAGADIEHLPKYSPGQSCRKDGSIEKTLVIRTQ